MHDLAPVSFPQPPSTKMKLKTSFYGIALFFTAISAYALDMRSTQPVAPASEVQTPAPVNSAAVTNDRIRQIVRQSGLDPDSDKGRLLVKLYTRVATDAEFRNNFSKLSQTRALFGGQLSPDDRLRVLQLIKDITEGPKNDCEALIANGRDAGDFVLLAKTLSTQGFQDLLEILEISADRGMPDSNDERYTTAELLDADAELESSLESKLPSQLGAKGASNVCELMRVSIDAIDALPPSSRQRATYEFFQSLNNKTSAPAKVLADPYAYLDDTFDERRLPDSIRQKLPKNGSHPLPFSRLVIDAEDRDPSKPNQSTPFKDTYVNRRNNGVIAEVVMSSADSTRPDWSDFYLSYGVANLLTQSVGTHELTPLGTLKDTAAIDAASQPLLEGHSIEITAPLPSEEGEISRTCEVGKTVPASTLFKSLDGDAVSLHCRSVTKRETVRFDLALLVNYGIQWATSFDHEDGRRTDVVIKNVTIQQP